MPAGYLIEGLYAIGRYARAVDEEGHRLGRVGAVGTGCGMVGKDGDGDGIAPLLQGFKDGAYGTAVEVLDGAQLQRHVALVASLIAGFDVEVYEVVGLEASMAAAALFS